MQAGVGKLHLRFDAGHLDHPKAGRLPSGIPEERRLPDAGFAADHEGAALAPAYIVQQPVKDLALLGPTPKRGQALVGHRAERTTRDRTRHSPSATGNRERSQWRGGSRD